jgi:hypothetical protein
LSIKACAQIQRPILVEKSGEIPPNQEAEPPQNRINLAQIRKVADKARIRTGCEPVRWRNRAAFIALEMAWRRFITA